MAALQVSAESSRHILEIDHKPAATVYRTWVGGELDSHIDGSADQEVGNTVRDSDVYMFEAVSVGAGIALFL